MDNDWTRVTEDHPDCCQNPGCLNKVMPDAKFCAAHGGNMGSKVAAVKRLKNYRLSKWKYANQVAEKAESSAIKSLVEEIAILRIMLQTHLENSEDDFDLMLKSGPISDLTTKINTLVTNCNNIDKSLGNLIDKEKVVAFAQAIVSIITPHIPEDKLDELTEQIKNALNIL